MCSICCCKSWRTDAQGRRVDFKNTVIILTSNVGARLITAEQKTLGFGTVEEVAEVERRRIRDSVMGELKKVFRPEFLNRVDDTIVFEQLSQSDIEEIARRLLQTLHRRLADMELGLQVSEEAIAEIARAGFDPVYGARPLRRAIRAQIEDPLAEKMLEGAFAAGDTVSVSFADGQFVFEKVAQ